MSVLHVVFVRLVFNRREIQGSAIREHETVLFQEFFSGIQNSFQGRVIKQSEAHPIGHNYVHLFDRQFHIFNLPFYQGHCVSQIVVLDNLGCVIKNVGHVDAVYMLGTCLCSKQRQKSQSTTHIQDNLVFE